MRMTPTNQKQGGKYNQNKEWEDEGKTGEPFQSADGMFVNRPKVAVIDNNPEQKDEPNNEEQSAQEETPVEEQEETKYNRVDYKKRYDDLKRHHDRKINTLKSEIEEIKKRALESRPKYTPPKSAEELEEWRKENPDIYAVVESVAHIRSTEEVKELQEQLKNVKEQLTYEAANRAYAELKSLVPDFEEIRANDDFHAWAEEQPEEIQNWVYKNSTNVQLAAKAINLYKADRGLLNAQAQEQKPPVQTSSSAGGADEAIPTTARVEEPTSNGGRIWKASEIAALSTKQAEQYMEEIDLAFAEGRVDPDS